MKFWVKIWSWMKVFEMGCNIRRMFVVKESKKKFEMCNSGCVICVWFYMVFEMKFRVWVKLLWYEGKLIRCLIKL